MPVSSWTMAKEGSKRVEIIGIDDKRQITAVFGGTLVGDFLPPQLIYQGKTTKYLPSVDSPQDWHVTYTENHWANEATMVDYLEKIIFPIYREKETRTPTSRGLPSSSPFQLISWTVHREIFFCCLKPSMYLLKLFQQTARTGFSC